MKSMFREYGLDSLAHERGRNNRRIVLPRRALYKRVCPCDPFWYAWMDLNHRSSSYEEAALGQLSYRHQSLGLLDCPKRFEVV